MPRKALFLDRDGIINVNHGYVHQPAQFEWVPGIRSLLKAAQRKHYTLVIVTNQSGVARGYYSAEQYQAFERWIEHQLWREGIVIQHTYHCPHHPKVNGPNRRSCACRKPRPGMLIKAARDFDISLKHSLMVGDSRSDAEAALRAGLKHGILFRAQRRLAMPALYRSRLQPYYHCSELSAITALL
ncbi:MAG: HAD family hydrolase [Oleiphilaceae bacterium]|nr:HAD family hydrolase [Oleiphilaceae bacterium]